MPADSYRAMPPAAHEFSSLDDELGYWKGRVGHLEQAVRIVANLIENTVPENHIGLHSWLRRPVVVTARGASKTAERVGPSSGPMLLSPFIDACRYDRKLERYVINEEELGERYGLMIVRGPHAPTLPRPAEGASADPQPAKP